MEAKHFSGSRRTRVQRGRSGWAAGLVAIALLGSAVLGGCAAGARPDFDLNRGEVEQSVEEDPATASIRFEDVFPMLGAASDSAWVYRVREGDSLEVVFFSHPEQNRFVTVRPDGRITLPYLGDVYAARKSTVDLASEIQTAYAEVLVNPRVDVIVQQMGARYYVLGEVDRPGEFEYDRPLGLVQALAAAGGYSDKARLSHVVLLRQDDQGRTWAGIFDFRDFMDARTRAGNVAVRPEDIVWIPKSAMGRWDDATRQSLQGILTMGQIATDVWSLANFEQVYARRF